VLGILSGFAASVISDADGRFRLGPFPAGTVAVQVADVSQLDPDTARSTWLCAQILTLAPGEHRQDIGFVASEPRAPLRGRVLDSAGRGLPGALVLAHLALGGGARIEEAAVFTDESGAFEFTGLTAGTHELRALHPTLGEARASGITPGTGNVPLTLRPP
jgi:hypothetical protein